MKKLIAEELPNNQGWKLTATLDDGTEWSETWGVDVKLDVAAAEMTGLCAAKESSAVPKRSLDITGKTAAQIKTMVG